MRFPHAPDGVPTCPGHARGGLRLGNPPLVAPISTGHGDSLSPRTLVSAGQRRRRGAGRKNRLPLNPPPGRASRGHEGAPPTRRREAFHVKRIVHRARPSRHHSRCPSGLPAARRDTRPRPNARGRKALRHPGCDTSKARDRRRSAGPGAAGIPTVPPRGRHHYPSRRRLRGASRAFRAAASPSRRPPNRPALAPPPTLTEPAHQPPEHPPEATSSLTSPGPVPGAGVQGMRPTAIPRRSLSHARPPSDGVDVPGSWSGPGDPASSDRPKRTPTGLPCGRPAKDELPPPSPAKREAGRAAISHLHADASVRPLPRRPASTGRGQGRRRAGLAAMLTTGQGRRPPADGHRSREAGTPPARTGGSAPRGRARAGLVADAVDRDATSPSSSFGCRSIALAHGADTHRPLGAGHVVAPWRPHLEGRTGPAWRHASGRPAFQRQAMGPRRAIPLAPSICGRARTTGHHALRHDPSEPDTSGAGGVEDLRPAPVGRNPTTEDTTGSGDRPPVHGCGRRGSDVGATAVPREPISASSTDPASDP